MIPKLIYGTAWKKDRTADLVEQAVLAGFQGIDTACQPKHYNEAGVGEALMRLGRPLFIQTKFTPVSGQDRATVPYDPSASLQNQVQESCAVSLKNLKHIDALLLHSPLPRHEQTMEAWQAMEKLCEQGKVRMLGISNCYDLEAFKLIYAEASIKPVIIQNRFYDKTGYDKLLRAWCKENNVHYQSFWTLSANPHILQSLSGIAASKGVTGAQIFFRFLTQVGIIPLIGTCSAKHMQEDLAIFDFMLSNEEMEQINNLMEDL
jgi:diketogulonate reductase-like aldo/keto reductase